MIIRDLELRLRSPYTCRSYIQYIQQAKINYACINKLTMKHKSKDTNYINFVSLSTSKYMNFICIHVDSIIRLLHS